MPRERDDALPIPALLAPGERVVGEPLVEYQPRIVEVIPSRKLPTVEEALWAQHHRLFGPRDTFGHLTNPRGRPRVAGFNTRSLRRV